MAVRFKLRTPNGDKETAIFLIYYYDGKKFQQATGRRILPKFWNTRTERPKESYPSFVSLKSYLDSLTAAINDRHNFLLSQGRYPTEADFKDAIQKRSGVLMRDVPDILEVLDAVCIEQRDNKSTYHKVKFHLTAYLKDRRISKELTAINAKWFAAFQKWMIARAESEGHAYRVIKQLKTVIRHAPHEWEGKAAVLAQKIVASSQAKTGAYLNWQEWETLKNSPMPDDKMHQARLLFCLHCLTGLRVSDWKKFRIEDAVHIAGKDFVQVLMTKTRNERKIQTAWIPVFEETRKLYAAIDPSAWNTDIESGRVMLNRIIKDVAKIAGIDSPTRQTYKSRGESLEKTKMKSRMVSTKICRKTFVSNFRQTGIPTDLLYLMTGHESGKSAAMANTYDARQFETVAETLLPYLEKFERNLPFSGTVISWI